MPKVLFQQESRGKNQKLVFHEHVEGLAAAMKEQAEDFAEPTGEDFWTHEVETPVEKVKFGENQQAKLSDKGRNQFAGLIMPTLQSPDIVLHKIDKDGKESHEYYKVFKKEDGHRYFLSVAVPIKGERIVITNHVRQEKQLKKAIESGELIYASERLKLSGGPFLATEAGFPAEYGNGRTHQTPPDISPSAVDARPDSKSSISQKEKDVNGGEIKKILFQEESVEPADYINYLLGKLQSRILKNEVYKEAWTG